MAKRVRSSGPVWEAPVARAERPRLKGDVRAEVCVIGAGIAGLSVAYLLAKAGRRVTVLDQDDVRAGETVRTTAHLTSALDSGYVRLEKLHGSDGARLAAQSHEVAIKRVHAIAAEEGISCGLETVDGYAFGGDPAALDAELAAGLRAGLALERVDSPEGPFELGHCLKFPRQAQLDPARYLDGLAAAAERRGARIFAGARAAAVEAGRVTTEDGTRVAAAAVVVATNSPFTDHVLLQTKQAPFRTYALALELPEGSARAALYWDAEEPYHYVRFSRPVKGSELVIVGGEDHPTGKPAEAAKRFARLERWTRERFPDAGPVAARWSGQVLEPVDGLALIGRDPMNGPDVYAATGHSGNGITYGTIAGMLLSDVILGRRNDWAALYDPSRYAAGAAAGYAERGLSASLPYADWALRSDAPSVRAVRPGCGAVVRCGLGPVAVSRDGKGAVSRLFPACRHLGGMVRWNDAERSWDCPVHGARYDADGRALNGPAAADLLPGRE